MFGSGNKILDRKEKELLKNLNIGKLSDKCLIYSNDIQSEHNKIKQGLQKKWVCKN